MPSARGGFVGERIDIHVPITKVEKNDDGSRTVIGVVTEEVLDRDGQIVDKGWATERLQDWFNSAANVRQMHSGSYPPAGKGKDLKWAKGRPVLRSKVVEPTAIKLLDEEVYTGYSVGIFDPCIYADPSAPNGRIGKAGPEDTGWIGEVSLVDLPSCPTAVYSLVKRASATSPAELVMRLELAGEDGTRVAMTSKRMSALHKAFKAGGSAQFSATLRKIVEADDTGPDTRKVLANGCTKSMARASARWYKAISENVGGGVDVDKLPPSAFVFPDTRNFPIVTPGDVSDAVSSWGRYKGEESFETFQKQLTRIAHREGPAFVKELPASWTDKSAAVDKQHPKANHVTCPSCGGKGTMRNGHRDCADCNGLGTVPESIANDIKEKTMAIETGKIAGAAVEAGVTAALLGKSPAEGLTGSGVTCPICRNGERKLASTCAGCRGVGVIPLTFARTIKTAVATRREDVKAAALAELAKNGGDADDEVDDAIDDLMQSLEEVAEAQDDDDDDDKPTDDAVNASIGQVGSAVSALAAAQAVDEAADAMGKGGGLANFGDAKADPIGSDGKTDTDDGGDSKDDKPKKKKGAKKVKQDKGTDGGAAKVDPADSAGAKPPDAVGEPKQGAPADTLEEEGDQGAAAKDATADKGKGKGKPGKKQGQLKPAEGTDTLDDNATPDAPPPAHTLKPGKGKAKGGGGMECPKCKGAKTFGDAGDPCPKCKGKGTLFGKKKSKSKEPDAAKLVAAPTSPVARRVHDVLCPCYPTEAVKAAWNFDGLPTADVINPHWFGDRLALLTDGTVKASPESVGDAYQAFAAANKIAALGLPKFEELRSLANKSFMDAYPSVTVAPNLRNPEDMKRGFLPTANDTTSSTTRVPTPSLAPTFTASDFTRGALTADEARPTLTGGTSATGYTGKGKKKGKRAADAGKADDGPVPTPSPSRLFYRTADKDEHSQAMSLLHDHIAQHYPGICPMDAVKPGTEIDSDGLMGSPAEMNAKGPDLPSLTSPAKEGTVGTLTPTSTGSVNKGAEEAPLTRAEALALVDEAVSKVETKAAKRERKLRRKVKAAERNEQRLLRLPDRTKAPQRGPGFRVIPGGADAAPTADIMKAAERTKTIEALKTKIADRNPSVSQRARDQLMALCEPEEFAAIAVAAGDED
jgi:hypothetical protein